MQDGRKSTCTIPTQKVLQTAVPLQTLLKNGSINDEIRVVQSPRDSISENLRHQTSDDFCYSEGRERMHTPAGQLTTNLRQAPDAGTGIKRLIKQH